MNLLSFGPQGKIKIFLLLILIVFFIILFSREAVFKKFFFRINTVTIYFIKGGRLESVERILPEGLTDEEKLKFAIEQLIKGPEVKEKNWGYSTTIPKGLRLISAKIEKDQAHLNFSKELANYGGGTATVQSLINQIVYTATEIKPVKRVKFFIEGKDEEIVLGGEGFVIDRPLGRNDLNL